VFGVSTATTAGQLARLLRWRDGNPLRRRTDRLEAAIVTGLLATFLIAAPVLAIVAGRVTNDMGLREQRAEQSWQQVSATVMQGVATAIEPTYGSTGNWVLARWTTPGGRQLKGLLSVDTTARPGQRIRIWINGAGHLTAPPLSHTEIEFNVALAALVAPVVLAVVLLAAAGSVHLVLNRRRMADWEQAWRSVGPRWTRQP
jgi:hypothetical protein